MRAPKKITVRVTPDRLPQVTVFRGGRPIGTGAYGGPLGLVNQSLDSELTDDEWRQANDLVRIWHKPRPSRRSR